MYVPSKPSNLTLLQEFASWNSITIRLSLCSSQVSHLGCSLYRFHKANNFHFKSPKGNLLFPPTTIQHNMNVPLQKFAHGANYYNCNFKRTALCENRPFHLIYNPPFEVFLFNSFKKEKSRCRHIRSFRNF